MYKGYMDKAKGGVGSRVRDGGKKEIIIASHWISSTSLVGFFHLVHTSVNKTVIKFFSGLASVDWLVGVLFHKLKGYGFDS